MFEVLFFLTALYLGYVAKEAYQAVAREEKGEPVFEEKPKPAPAPKVVAKAAETPKPAAPAAKVAAAPKAAPAPKPAPAAKPKAEAPKKPAAPVKAAAPKAAAKPKATKASESKVVLADDLKNPETGEITPAPANYRFAKKWIKDALVEEKLLDRVYKPNELDDAASTKVKEAIDKLRGMKKYQA
jgi:outer membrane biosynthesis protein TonB